MFRRPQLIILSLALVALVYVEASGLHIRQYGNKKHPTLDDHCYYEDYDVSVKLHESVTPTNIPHQCLKFSCDDEFILTMEGCPPTLKTCKEIDITKPFPDCCTCKVYD